MRVDRFREPRVFEALGSAEERAVDHAVHTMHEQPGRRCSESGAVLADARGVRRFVHTSSSGTVGQPTDAKAERELGATFRPLAETIGDVVRWYAKHDDVMKKSAAGVLAAA